MRDSCCNLFPKKMYRQKDRVRPFKAASEYIFPSLMPTVCNSILPYPRLSADLVYVFRGHKVMRRRMSQGLIFFLVLRVISQVLPERWNTECHRPYCPDFCIFARKVVQLQSGLFSHEKKFQNLSKASVARCLVNCIDCQ